MDSYQFIALQQLHNSQWNSALLGDDFTFVYNWILTKRERIVLDLKVQFCEEGYTEKEANTEIARLLKLKIATIVRCIYSIKSKYRNMMDIRVDNKLHPEIHRQKLRKVRLMNESLRSSPKGN